MIARTRTFVILLGAAAAAGAVVVARRAHGAMGRRVPGGILIGDARLYDAVSHRLLLGSLFERIAADVAAVALDGGRVLEVGCGPGRLSIVLARQYGLEVTGLDLDPAMIERARADASRSAQDGREPSFLVRGLAGAPRPIVRPGPQHALVASLGRPDGRADRDRPRAATGGSGAHLGLPGRARPAARADARSGRARAGVLASGSERDTLALALEIQAHEADRAGPADGVPENVKG